ncbi:hypothetical protein ISN76_16165 [Dyella halodurans]
MDRESSARLTVSLPSPKSAAEGGAVYRRRRAERPRDRWLRILALVGALVVHLVFLVGVILGPAYEQEEPNEASTTALQVRLIEKKQEEPPPPPPVRGTPPRQVGPIHRGNAANAPRTVKRSTPATRTNNDISPVPVPALEIPVIATAAKPTGPKPEITAAPLPPVTVPKPAATKELQPVPTAAQPPQVALETPPVSLPVPPKFQPEPVRKPQLEGNEPVPPPASLAIPEIPPQSAPVVEAPTVAMEKAAPANTPPSVAAVARPEQPAAPPEPETQAVPIPAQPAPTVNLQPEPSTVTPVVSRERPQIQAPAIQVAEPELEAVPLPPNPQPSLERPQAPRLETAAPKAIALENTPAIERPQISTEQPSAAPSPASAAPASTPSAAPSPSAAAAQESTASSESSKSAGQQGASSAPNATPQGSSAGTPGQPSGVNQSPAVAGKNGLNLSVPPGQGNGQGQAGQQGQNESGGPTGTYVQLKPHGNTEIMSHGTPNIGYESTRFEKDWTPEGESSIDTALRHAVEKTTMRHTFHLPRGVRVECVVMPLFPMALFGCGNGDPPPKPVDDVVYQRMKLAPSNPLVTPAPAATQAAPVIATAKLDNSAQCAAARVGGGPLPPGCEVDPPAVNPAPARAGSTWVPASDQFH